MGNGCHFIDHADRKHFWVQEQCHCWSLKENLGIKGCFSRTKRLLETVSWSKPRKKNHVIRNVISSLDCRRRSVRALDTEKSNQIVWNCNYKRRRERCNQECRDKEAKTTKISQLCGKSQYGKTGNMIFHFHLENFTFHQLSN